MATLDRRSDSVVAHAAAAPTSKPVPPWVKMLAGMAAGATEASALQPLDVAKTRLQLDRTGKYKGLIDCGRTIVRDEGARALYKGLTPFVTHLTLKYALRFGAFGYFKKLMGAKKGAKWEAGRDFMAGLLAGLTEAVLIVTPFEVVKTRLQKQEGLKNLKYRGPIHAAMTIAKEEGPAALWKGCVPTMLRQGTNQAFNFAGFILLQRLLFNRVEGDAKQQAMWQPLVTGLISSAVGPLLNCPLDVIKTRMMAQDNKKGEEAKYKGWIDCGRTIAREEGVRALWKGIIPRLARLAPGQAITWTVVTRVETWYEQRELAAAQAEAAAGGFRPSDTRKP